MTTIAEGSMHRRLIVACLCLMTGIADAHRETPSSPVPDPCGGRSGLLAELDRPTVADSVCAVKPGRVIVEAGYAHGNTSAGASENAPQAEIRFGLAHGNEFVVVPPNVTYRPNGNVSRTSYGSTTMGLKHEWGYTRHWSYAGEVLLTTPSPGRPAARSIGWGEAVNGIVSYSITSHVAVGLMLGATAQYDRYGQRYTSINPDVTATWLLNSRWQLYGEIYGQTHAGYGLGSGWASDGGVQYLVTRRIEVDAELGQRLSGPLGDYRHYWGVGAGWEF